MSSNGKLNIAVELVPISGTYLAPATAAAFQRMAAACLAATGVRLDIVNGSGGYRDIDAQTALYRNPPAGIRVASPGSSTHGFGRALDLTTTCYTPAVAAWCKAHCKEYGFTVPPTNDPRHFQHNGLAPAGSPIKEIDMQLSDQVPPNTGDASVAAYLYYTRTDVARILAGQAALTAAVQALATAKGISDPAAFAASIAASAAAAVDKALADNFAQVNANIDDQPTHFTITPAN